MHSLFFFGFPLTQLGVKHAAADLRNVNPRWKGLSADEGRSEASDYIMDWIFNTYNDLLVKENRNAKGNGHGVLGLSCRLPDLIRCQ